MLQQRSSVVFVGNLPFNYTEEQFAEVFSSVGPVDSFRLVVDHATGKLKGFGFCEYFDPETAASALRNLQGVEVGGRQLRLDFADTADVAAAKRDRGPPARDRAGPGGAGGPGGRAPDVVGKPLPAGISLLPGVSAVDSISQTLAVMPPGQLLDIMSQMKALVTTSPNEARTLLSANPQLSYALFQAMIMMNIVDPAVIQRMAPPPAPAPYHDQRPPANYGTPPPPAAYPTSGGGNPNSYNRAPSYASTPPYSQAPPPGRDMRDTRYPTPTNMAPPPPQGGAAPAPDQAALIQQVLSMTQQQIDALPFESRDTILKIRAQAAASMSNQVNQLRRD